MIIWLILKGFIVGLGKIVPGVSGSILAMSMGIYEDLIMAVTDFFGDVKKNSKILFPFSLGLGIAIIFFSKILLFLLEHYYYVTLYLFLGLILGTSVSFVKKVSFEGRNKYLFAIFLGLFLFLDKFSLGTLYVFDGSGWSYFYTMVLGVIDAVTSIIPGISGTAIYLLLGVYQYVLSIFSNPFSAKFILFICGVLGGVVGTSYVMRFLLIHYKKETYATLLSFLVGSMLLLMKSLFLHISIGLVVVMFLGIILGKMIEVNFKSK